MAKTNGHPVLPLFVDRRQHAHAFFGVVRVNTDVQDPIDVDYVACSVVYQNSIQTRVFQPKRVQDRALSIAYEGLAGSGDDSAKSTFNKQL